MSGLYDIARPLLFKMDAEKAHNLTLKALKCGLIPSPKITDTPDLRVSLWNRSFPNPLGLAAGFDKNAEVIAPTLRMGFGFVEAGTVTPKPQYGNPRPRIFRCPEQGAVINAMGFPNKGLNQFKRNLQIFLEKKPRPAGLVGINISINKNQRQPIKDYCILVQQLGPLADYMTINISSPNTPGLKDLQNKKDFTALIEKIKEQRAESCGIHPPPLLVKFSSDLHEQQLEDLAEACLNVEIDGVILTNTSADRPEYLPAAFRQRKGGLSGTPINEKSTQLIHNFYKLTDGKIPIIGLGGVSCGEDAYNKIRSGANLVQVYTGLVYKGPDLIEEILTTLSRKLKEDNFKNIEEAVGANHKTSTT